MAARGSTKDLSLKQEDRVARKHGGTRSPSSGAAITDQGDVRTPNELIECKHAGTYSKPAASITIKLADLEKIADEAWSEGKEPVMALSLYAPDSVLADANGEVNLILRLEDDDIRGRMKPQLHWIG